MAQQRYVITGFVIDEDTYDFKDTTTGNATTTESGFMSAVDKVSLDDVVQAIANMYTKAQVDAAISQATAIAYQELNYGTLTRQLNTSILGHKFVSLVFRRYGYFDTMLIPVDTIKAGLCTSGTHIRYGNNDITVAIDQNGLITLSGTSASDLAIEARGFM